MHETLCLHWGDGFESVVKDIISPALAGLEAVQGPCGCRVQCPLGCLGKSFCLFPWVTFSISPFKQLPFFSGRFVVSSIYSPIDWSQNHGS